MSRTHVDVHIPLLFTKLGETMIGWVQISRREVARAEQALLGEGKGVRDEIGLLSIHQAIADRLFPGTSVLHTRLRYALFVPWLIRRAAVQQAQSHTASLRGLELSLTGQLVGTSTEEEAVQKGIVGGRVFKRSGAPAAQPPSYSYWSALSTWGILGNVGTGRTLTREQAMRVLHQKRADRRRAAKDELGNVIDDGMVLFAGLPDEPGEFLVTGKPMKFALTSTEHTYLQKRLLAVARPGDEEPSLLARLAGTKAGLGADMPWDDPGLLALADAQDRRVLKLARGMSALGGIARGVYLALLEEACRNQGLVTTFIHRRRLDQLTEQYGADATELDLGELAQADLKIDDAALIELLRFTQRWISGAGSLGSLKILYRDCERQRKKDRCRLADTEAADARRRNWVRYEGKAEAERLHFRWPNVRRLLNDLHAAGA